MELEVVSVVGTRAKIYLATRHHQGFNARAVGERVRRARERILVLPFVLGPFYPTP